MARPKKEESGEGQEVKITPQGTLNALLKANKEDHFNDSDEIEVPLVSSGSLILDSQLGGGFGPGLHRLVGFTEAGKSSCALEVCRNFLKSTPNSRALIVKAEGRLSKEMRERSGVNFVWKTEDWVEGTCFVLETNVYELVIGVMRDLVVNNPENKNKYIFVLDSMDGLILKSDMEKPIESAGRVAGAPMLTKKFMQRLAIAMNKFGHRCFMIGQVSAKVEIDPYAPKDQRQISATGGNAALHFANFIIQFEPRYGGDLILEDPTAKPDAVKNKIIGHWCKTIIKKSPNEHSNVPVAYPIKYGRKGGTSIWREYEIVDVLLQFQKITRTDPNKVLTPGEPPKKPGAWFYIDLSLVEEIKREVEIEIPPKFQGMESIRLFLEEQPKVADYLFVKLRNMISGGT
jgi:hypothetical protein